MTRTEQLTGTTVLTAGLLVATALQLLGLVTW